MDRRGPGLPGLRGGGLEILGAFATGKTPARRPEPDDAFKTARATPPPPPKPLRRSPRRSPPKAEPVLQTPSVTFAQTPAAPPQQAPAAPTEPAPADHQGPARTSNVSDMSLDDEDEEEEPPRRSERVRLRTSSASEASAEDAPASSSNTRRARPELSPCRPGAYSWMPRTGRRATAAAFQRPGRRRRRPGPRGDRGGHQPGPGRRGLVSSRGSLLIPRLTRPREETHTPDARLLCPGRHHQRLAPPRPSAESPSPRRG
mgnify:CR=1 FL=1